jgi:hypothetical protein
LAEYEIGVGIAGAALTAIGVERRVVLQHPAVAVVGDVEIARLVERYAGRPAQAVEAYAA